MIKGFDLKNIYLLLSVIVVLVAIPLQAQARDCNGDGVDEGSECCLSSDPKPGACADPLYTCKKISGERKCVCRWGNLEKLGSGNSLFPGADTNNDNKVDVCELVTQLGPGSNYDNEQILPQIVQVFVIIIQVVVVGAAAVSIVIGGYIYMTAGGSADRVRQAKAWIGAAILGIILVMFSWLIFNIINEGFTNFRGSHTVAPSSTPSSSP